MLRPYIIRINFNQYIENNVMQILFNLLRIKGFYMFRALLAHPQEGLHKRHLVYSVRVMTSLVAWWPELLTTNMRSGFDSRFCRGNFPL
jgi:hypothetical protein